MRTVRSHSKVVFEMDVGAGSFHESSTLTAIRKHSEECASTAVSKLLKLARENGIKLRWVETRSVTSVSFEDSPDPEPESLELKAETSDG